MFWPPVHTAVVDTITLGLCSRTGSAVAVAVRRVGGTERVSFTGRWQLDLTDDEIADQLYHVAADMRADRARAYVARATKVVGRIAVNRLRALAAQLPGLSAAGVIVGDHPISAPLEKILASHPLAHAAEGQFYRDALIDAAAECGLQVSTLSRDQAAARLSSAAVAPIIAVLGSSAGPPWRKEHKLAAVAAHAAVLARP